MKDRIQHHDRDQPSRLDKVEIEQLNAYSRRAWLYLAETICGMNGLRSRAFRNGSQSAGEANSSDAARVFVVGHPMMTGRCSLHAGVQR